MSGEKKIQKPIQLPVSYAGVNQEVEQQPPLLRVTTGPDNARTFYRLAGGKSGSLQTAAIMANLVRDDAVKNKRLELWATQILINRGLDSHSDPYEVADTLLRYVQQFSYIHDPAGAFDSVQSAEQVIREGKGDCDDLSVLLATLLALVGFKPRFVMAKYKNVIESGTDSFDHVYVDLELPQGRVALDPSSRNHGIGWESPKAIERVAYPIFDGRVVGLGDIAAKVKSMFSGMGCSRSSCGCGASRGVSGNAAVKGVAGSGDVSALGGVSLSLPAILLSVGAVVVTLKLVDKFLEG